MSFLPPGQLPSAQAVGNEERAKESYRNALRDKEERAMAKANRGPSLARRIKNALRAKSTG